MAELPPQAPYKDDDPAIVTTAKTETRVSQRSHLAMTQADDVAQRPVPACAESPHCQWQ
jgi:hypothetical protein